MCMAVAIRGLKKKKTAGEDKILLGVLKALDRERVHWLTRVCQVVWKPRKQQKALHTSVMISVYYCAVQINKKF